MDEWKARVEIRVARIMSGKRIVQLSGLFDDPQFADHFVRLMKEDPVECRDICIKARVRLSVDAKSKPKKSYRLAWQRVA